MIIHDQVPPSENHVEMMSRVFLERQLPVAFVTISDDGSTVLSFWSIEETGDNEIDKQRGINFGEMALKISRDPQMQVFVAMVLGEMVERGRMGPIEAGFIIKISRSALAGALN